MLLSRKSVELLAPAGTWASFEAAVRAGADAVYLGGKRFNMRLHRADANFDDTALKQAVDFAHARGVRLYVTINNLLSDREIEPMRDYLQFLQSIGPDALLVQDPAVLELTREMNIAIPLHASVMMNTHNEFSVRKLMEYGITRVVVGRETTLAALSLLRERTGIEVEYFMHGDMCIAQSGQCYHSGVLFGQSSNRGRCLKPCRWAYRLIDEATGTLLDETGPYKLALKDMCMYRNLPELIQAGVHSFKIEGRMRTPAFVERIVRTYRDAINRYIDDPTGYRIDETAWKELYDNRSRDFSTCFALGHPDASDIGFDGKREPRFFSQAVKEAGLNARVFKSPAATTRPVKPAELAVRVADLAAAEAACKNGADRLYIGGEAFLPQQPWTLDTIKQAMDIAARHGAKLIVTTARAAAQRECGELEQLFSALDKLRPDGIMVGNLGTLYLAKQITSLPIQTDFSFNTFNGLSAKFLQSNGAVRATASLEASHAQLLDLLAASPLPIEIIVHGATEAMILDHNIPAMSLSYKELCNPEFNLRHYALLDSAHEVHPIRMDQHGRGHILFAKDLCLLPYLSELPGAAAYRLEAQHYAPELVGRLTELYKNERERIGSASGADQFSPETLAPIIAASPRALGIGPFRYRVSR